MNQDETFYKMRQGLLYLDPVYWIEQNLTLDGLPFRLNGNGYKPLVDIYRHIGVKALERSSKPVLISKARQVGMTTAAAALELYFMASGLFGTSGRPPIRIMHAFPQLELAYAYTKTKLNSMISGANPTKTVKKGRAKSVVEMALDQDVSGNDSLHFKQFSNGNHLWVDSTGLTADRIRGRTVDGLFFDEVQDMRAEAIANAKKILSQAKYGQVAEGLQVYFGTPKQAGSAFWEMWKDSNQQFYYLGCEKCKDFFPLYTAGNNDWEKIWLHGFIVKCTKCEHEQNKIEAAERGKWVVTGNPDADYVGFHLNQLYNPVFSKEAILKEKPENSAVNTERAYQNEVLGEFFAGSSSPITAEELSEKCADIGRKFTRSISHAEPRRVYLGLDWGQKVDLDQMAVGEGGPRTVGQSYSVAVILTADNPNILSIEYATKLKQNDLSYKKEIVEELFRTYRVNQAVGDIGYANDLCGILQHEYGERFLASRAVSQIKNHIKYEEAIFPKEVMFERDYYIAMLYDFMKQGKIRFPFGNYEQISFMIAQICGMEIKPSKDKYGEVKTRYVKGRIPNDAMMALLNAFLAWRFDLTSGFKVQDTVDLIKNYKNKKQIPAITGYFPTRR